MMRPYMLIPLLLAGCNVAPGGFWMDPVCKVGSTRACQCDGESGTSVCKDEGESFGPSWSKCSSCKAPVQPGLLQGEPCAADTLPCASGLACNFATEPSVCDAARIFGAICQTEVDCQPGLECNFIWDPMQCRPPGQVGDPCYGKPPASCAPGLVCNWALGSEPQQGRCAEPGQAGDPCAQNTDCASDLACADGKCAAASP